MKKIIKYTLLTIFVIGFIAAWVMPIANIVKGKVIINELNKVKVDGLAHRLDFQNAYGNNSAYHPSVVNFDDKWNGYQYWMGHTPYPNGDDGQENPHIMASNDLEHWVEPEGFKNPLEPAPEKYLRGKIYNSDTELVYNTDTKQLECWWRFVDDINQDLIIYRKTTKNGVDWSEKEVVFKETRDKKDYISPALIYDEHKYKMWYVDSPYSVYYIESSDLKNWTKPYEIKITYDDPNLRSWHLDVVHEAGMYEMVINAFIKGKHRRSMNLYYSKSTDNINWTHAKTIITPSKGTKKWDNQGIYRASLMYDKNTCYLFYSAISTEMYEGVGLVRLSNKWREE